MTASARPAPPRRPTPLARIPLGTLGVLLLALVPSTARAQMPDLRAIVGRPLPVPELGAGTVTVRVARKMPANAAADIEVTAVVKAPGGGDSRTRSVKTGPDGRATFDGLQTGAEFQARATVDGEALETQTFAIPGQGGIRVMLIAGLGGAPPGGDSPAEVPEGRPGEAFRIGATTGTVGPAQDLPVGTLEIDLRDAEGKPIPLREVQLGEVRLAGAEHGGAVEVHRARSDESGRARFTNLSTGEAAGYAAVFEHQGARASTMPFRMITASGMRGEIKAVRRTADPASLRIDRRSKIVIDLREDAIAVMAALIFQNVSSDSFDPGEAGLRVPLPPASIGAQEIPGGTPLEVHPGEYVRLKEAVLPPQSGDSTAVQARFGYILPAEGAGSLQVSQPLPFGLEDPFIIVPAKTGLSLSAPGLKTLPAEGDGEGNKMNEYSLPRIPPGGTLTLTVSGIPTRDRTGHTVAYSLVALLVIATLLASRQPASVAKAAASRESLVEKREKLFSELVAIDQAHRLAGAAHGAQAPRRREVVAKLEAVYRELARHAETGF